jgi:hypothetical protein
MMPIVLTGVAGQAEIDSFSPDPWTLGITRNLLIAPTMPRIVSTLAGGQGGASSGYLNGIGTNALFDVPLGIAIDPTGTFALTPEYNNHVIRRLDIASRIVTTFVGDPAHTPGYVDGIGSTVQFFIPIDIAMDSRGSVAVISDAGNKVIRFLVIATLQVTTLAGSAGGGFANGIGTNALFGATFGVAVDAAATFALIADLGNAVIRRINISSGNVSTLAGQGSPHVGYADGPANEALFAAPFYIAMDAGGTFALMVRLIQSWPCKRLFAYLRVLPSQTDSVNNVVQRIVVATGYVSTLAGGLNNIQGASSTDYIAPCGVVDGIGSHASFCGPNGIAVDAEGTFAVVVRAPFVRPCFSAPTNTHTRRLRIHTLRDAHIKFSKYFVVFTIRYHALSTCRLIRIQMSSALSISPVGWSGP